MLLPQARFVAGMVALILLLALLCVAGWDRPAAIPTRAAPLPRTAWATRQRPGVIAPPAATLALTATQTRLPIAQSAGPTPTTSASPAPPTSTKPAPRPTTSPEPTLRECVVLRAFHYAQAHTAYRSGHTGPEYFDCTGLVYRVFADCAATHVIGAQGEQPVHGYYKWFSARGQADSLPPQKGDLVLYGPQHAHIAIYVGEGRAISTLLDGVRVHDAASLGSIEPDERMPVEAYLHIRPDQEVHSREQLCP